MAWHGTLSGAQVSVRRCGGHAKRPWMRERTVNGEVAAFELCARKGKSGRG